jgi:CMP-N-acetylneuraminic acid synthetase
MYKKKRILGLITARGGSKGLPGKNILPLCGKPLIAWTIEQAKSSKYLDAVVVSTDDENIARISKQFGAEVPFQRPAKLASDTATSMDVIFHALEFLAQQGRGYEYLALLEPTSPLRKKGDLDRAIKHLIDADSGADSLVSLGKIALEHPIYSKTVNSAGRVVPYFKQKRAFARRQDLPIAYFPYGVIYLSKVSALRKYRTFYQKRTISYLIERWQNYEIDDAYDYKCIVSIMKEKKGEIG